VQRIEVTVAAFLRCRGRSRQKMKKQRHNTTLFNFNNTTEQLRQQVNPFHIACNATNTRLRQQVKMLLRAGLRSYILMSLLAELLLASSDIRHCLTTFSLMSDIYQLSIRGAACVSTYKDQLHARPTDGHSTMPPQLVSAFCLCSEGNNILVDSCPLRGVFCPLC
jgi:hypothetical protein